MTNRESSKFCKNTICVTSIMIMNYFNEIILIIKCLQGRPLLKILFLYLSWFHILETNRNIALEKECSTNSVPQTGTNTNYSNGSFFKRQISIKIVITGIAPYNMVYVYMLQRICGTRYSPESLGNITRYSLT